MGTTSLAWKRATAGVANGNARSMILNFGPAATTAFVYLQDDDTRHRQVVLHYESAGQSLSVADPAFPFEFTVPLAQDATEFRFQIETRDATGREARSEWVTLRK